MGGEGLDNGLGSLHIVLRLNSRTVLLALTTVLQAVANDIQKK